MLNRIIQPVLKIFVDVLQVVELDERDCATRLSLECDSKIVNCVKSVSFVIPRSAGTTNTNDEPLEYDWALLVLEDLTVHLIC
jgi:hypothetical protein